MAVTNRIRSIVAAGAVAVLIAGCVGQGDDDEGDVPGVDENGEQQDTDNEIGEQDNQDGKGEEEDGIERPDIVLPDDVINEYEEVETDDPVEQAVLADHERYLNAIDEAITQSDDEGGLAFYAEEPALLADVEYINGLEDDRLTFSGKTRYYNRQVELAGRDSAKVKHCMDASESHYVHQETGEETPDSGVTTYYESVLRLGDDGVWRTVNYSSERGVSQCD